MSDNAFPEGLLDAMLTMVIAKAIRVLPQKTKLMMLAKLQEWIDTAEWKPVDGGRKP